MRGGTAHRREAMRQAALNFAASAALALMLGTTPTSAAIEQCRFIQAKADREACYQRQDTALAAKRKPEPPRDTTLEQLQQMRREDDAVYKSLRGICRGC